MPIEKMNPLNSVASIADSVATGLDELFTSDEERERARLLMMKELNQPHVLQAVTNLQEAKHPHLFVAGWRPALGWLSVILLAYAWIGRDLLLIALGMFDQNEVIAGLPKMQQGELMTLVLALLGLGATRTYEKLYGKARSQWIDRGKGAGVPHAAQVSPNVPLPSDNDFSKSEKKKAFKFPDILHTD
jgi:hypothetical protein